MHQGQVDFALGDHAKTPTVLEQGGSRSTRTIDGVGVAQILQRYLETSQNNYMFEARLLMKYKDLLGRIGGANVPVTAGVREVTGDYQAEWSTIETELQRILTEDIPAYNRILRDAGLPEIYVPRPIT